jgi:cytochrome c biogenesis protein CcmG, thiol:disulfide interchange protein DsbE
MSPVREALHLERRRCEFPTRQLTLKHPQDPATGANGYVLAMRPLSLVRGVLTSLVCVALTAGCAGCGSSNPKSSAPSTEEIRTAFAGSPPALARLHGQANQLLGGKKSDFDGRMAELRGHPVVVNKWAAWCAPCRGEFPVFQQVGTKLGKRVAFVGLDGQDNDDSARKFLKQFPVTYPSYRDPDLKISSAIQAGIAFPTTIFFDRNGKLVYAHPGPYDKQSDLIADVRRYAR